MTLGEYRVGISFNPSSNPQVDAIKRAAADFIDLLSTDGEVSVSDEDAHAERLRKCIDAIDVADIPERGRLCAIALGCIDEAIYSDSSGDAEIMIETAAMWAVKAATKGPME